MSRFARPTVNQLHAYVPGEQPRPGDKVIKLNTNENPYPPSPNVMRKMKTLSTDLLRKYPQPDADMFREAAGKLFNIDPSQIITGNGSDELLTIIVRTFVDAGETILYPNPTYSLYPVLAKMQDAKITEIPFDDSYSLPDKLFSSKAKLCFIANPNAPSGTFISIKTIEAFARKFKGIVVIDEAYVDFAEDNSMRLAKKLSNVIVLRTLSKSYSLAGLRFGFAVAHQSLIEDMKKMKDSYNCGAVSITLATEAIRDQSYFKQNITKIIQERTRLTKVLRTLSFNVLDSSTNFLWATIDSPSAKEIYLKLKAQGILVRYFDKPGLRNGLRITVGTNRQNNSLLRTLTQILRME
jgi:histidinol-phosphate aminotransferase